MDSKCFCENADCVKCLTERCIDDSCAKHTKDKKDRIRGEWQGLTDDQRTDRRLEWALDEVLKPKRGDCKNRLEVKNK